METLMNMIGEKRLEELKKKGPAAWEPSDYQDLLNTLEALWKAVHATRKWIKATPGADSVQAEFDMVRAMDKLKENS